VSYKKKKIDDAALEHGVHPRPGQDFVLVATIPAADGIDIVGTPMLAVARVRTNPRVRFGECWPLHEGSSDPTVTRRPSRSW